MAAVAEPDDQTLPPSVQKKYDMPQLKEDIVQITIYSSTVCLEDAEGKFDSSIAYFLFHFE